ncbi:3' terminal RNA ribose 2'-O-methyltransferase Hen1 [Pseudonocardia spinosispora]|uniref:3' terminal RNA ribose 2'-O-methyltransferase Hen1 n=1 Tax=Pseudonocardia spinosispora TaxID=103441 RepID=UPI00041440E2|nr:3' terminal RNA ribose 2'-O-methyltransferase Hen1 [Pseudonocardia spinosispora]
MLLTITTTHEPADELGYLLAKHPDRVHRAELGFGTATVCFPEVGPARTTAALIVDVDPVGLVRRAAGVSGATPDGFSLGQHVNDRPYSASSLLSVAISRCLGSALGGRSRERPELAETPIPLELGVPAVRDADDLAAALFEPLGWTVERTPVGPVHAALSLRGTHRLAEALSQVYVLLPVLDDTKHYPVGADEAEKLLRSGGDWLAGHPERELITRRYLRYRRRLTSPLLETLGIAEDQEVPATPLRELRRDAVLAQLRRAGAHRVLDLGCGDGALLAELVKDIGFTEIVGVDASSGSLTRAERRLRLDELAPSARERLTLLHGALTYADQRLAGYDAAVLMEVIEHVDEPRLPALTASVFGTAAPTTVLVTTPNREYNVRYPDLPAGAFRHSDHRFEWDRARFAAWCSATAQEYGYRVEQLGIGEHDAALGSPTQLAVFSKGVAA